MNRKRQQTDATTAIRLGKEREILGSFLLMPELLPDYLHKLQPRDFIDPDHAHLWGLYRQWWADLPDESRSAVLDTSKGHNELMVDLLTMLAPDQTAERARLMLGELVAYHAHGAEGPLAHVIAEVAALAAQERYRAEVDRLQRQLSEEANPETRAEIALAIAAVPQPAGATESKKAGDWSDEVLSAVLRGDLASPWVCPTGLAAIDRRNGGGLHPGRLYVVAGRPGWGKSALAIRLAVEACRDGHGVGFASLEMAETDLVLRMAAYMTGLHLIDRDHAAFPLSSYDRMAIESAKTEIAGWNLHMRCQPTNVDQLEAWAGDLHQRANVKVLIVDYIGLVGGHRGQSQWERIGATSLRCKAISMRGLAVVACAQLNREAEAAERPGADTLAGADQIAMDADAVLIPWRPKGEGAPDDYAELLTVKGRRCKLGRDRIRWHGKTQSYHDSMDEWLMPIGGSQTRAAKTKDGGGF